MAEFPIDGMIRCKSGAMALRGLALQYGVLVQAPFMVGRFRRLGWRGGKFSGTSSDPDHPSDELTLARQCK